MAIIKLQNEGESVTLHIKTCAAIKGTYGWQVQFDSFDGKTLFLPLESANRQLLRCGFDSGADDENGEPAVNYEAAEGNHLTFARTHNSKPGAKPFWDVSVASGDEKHPKAASKRIPSPDTRTTGQRIIDSAVPPDAPPAHHAESGVPNSPDEVEQAATEALDAFTAKRGELIDRYIALYDYVAEKICTTGRAHDFPVDATGIQAATATIWITLKDRNLA